MLSFDFYIKCNLSNYNGVKSKFCVHFLNLYGKFRKKNNTKCKLNVKISHLSTFFCG